MKLKLNRPLVFFDLETTGTNPLRDRIVEISYLKVGNEGVIKEKTHRVRPVDALGRQVPSDPAAVAVHGITDESLASEPTFKELSGELRDVFEDADIAGYNSNKFDLPLLIEEFVRAGVDFRLAGRNLIDVQNIFYKHEPRTLKAAYRFYCDKDLVDAHQASADVRATYEVFVAQLEKYELGEDTATVARNSRLGDNIDLSGRLSRDKEGDAVFNFGKYKGKKVKHVFRQEPSYYSWMMEGDFAKDTKDIITAIFHSK
ncbi:MAG: 3'-5' exonuclease [Muribaculaceae bacterium]|nr:3'-5' exonuclease [Muribaculaceae bacterium]